MMTDCHNISNSVYSDNMLVSCFPLKKKKRLFLRKHLLMIEGIAESDKYIGIYRKRNIHSFFYKNTLYKNIIQDEIYQKVKNVLIRSSCIFCK